MDFSVLAEGLDAVVLKASTGMAICLSEEDNVRWIVSEV